MPVNMPPHSWRISCLLSQLRLTYNMLIARSIGRYAVEPMRWDTSTHPKSKRTCPPNFQYWPARVQRFVEARTVRGSAARSTGGGGADDGGDADSDSDAGDGGEVDDGGDSDGDVDVGNRVGNCRKRRGAKYDRN